jgi:ABC-2 type transport system permease protein
MEVEMGRQWSFLWALVSTNIKSSLSLRGSFFLQLVFMTINNLVFFSIWWIFFNRFPEVAGWSLREVEAMYGFTAGAFGLSVIFGGGVSELGRMIVDGELDSYLTQPKNVLLQTIASKSRASGWGDLITALVLLAMSGYLNWKTVPVIFVLLICSAFIFLSSFVIAQSLAFWLGPIQNLARQLSEFVITFSVYPQTIFPFFFKIVLFTIIPAGFIGFLPVEVMRNFGILSFIGTIAASSIYIGLALMVFQRGLRHYESGNRIG